MSRIFFIGGKFLLNGFFVASLLHCATAPYRPWRAQNPSNLAHDRSLFPTQLKKQRSSPVSDLQEPPPAGTTEVYYTSGKFRLKAWLSKLPDDGKKHPAVVFAHGGFSRDAEDWVHLKVYLDQGFIVMMPAWRGENSNPGYFEFFFGEVDDVIAAGEYLAANPLVDKDRLFLAGHSAGGTLAILTALKNSPYKAIASFSGSTNQEIFFRSKGIPDTPFDKQDGREVILRSPIAYASSLRHRLLLVIGANELSFERSSRLFSTKAKELGKNCDFIKVPGDHFSSLPGAMEKSIEFFNGKQWSIDLNDLQSCHIVAAGARLRICGAQPNLTCLENKS